MTQSLSALQAEAVLPVNPGRRRQASLPWAKVSQAFSLKAENARIVDKFSTNNPEVDTLGIEIRTVEDSTDTTGKVAS